MNKVSKEGLREKVTFEQRQQGGEEVSPWLLGGTDFQAEGTARAEVHSRERAVRSRSRKKAGAGVAGGE